MLQPEPVVIGAHNLDSMKDTPLVIVANHLSYSDANVVEVVLRNAGANCLADRLTAIAGPKVYSSVTRRFSSLCFGTIKVPQSSERSSEDAVMNPSDLARAAAQMQQFLPGTARYLEVPGTRVLPIGIAGTEKLFPIHGVALHAVPVTRITVRLKADTTDELHEPANPTPT